ncbi:DUF7322 domain-containing protein [Halorubellus salinus]|uniref:DUF7322 domain-containing protein n=1 Tax=Halorubellus salinus TaxID=755309 RepID=UPI001D070817|nr:hypothetical protein [Halorubellus salinus]
MTTEEDSPADADAPATESDASAGDTDSDATGGSDAASAARADADADGIESRLAGGPDGLADPRDGLQDPADNVPRPEVPDATPDAPEAPSTDDVPEGLRAEFWELVFAANVALFGLSLGAMLVGFQENVPLGMLSLLVGGLAGLFLVHRYRHRQHTP